jgi:hypothetical protein
MPPSKERKRTLARQARQIEAALGAARRQLKGGIEGGRAWINGSEVGGADARYAHLNRSYD